MRKRLKLLDLSRSFRRELATLALLTGLSVVLFLAVTAVSRIFHAQQDSLAIRWSTRGVADLHAQRYTSAATEFRTALLYSRGNYDYQLGLAQALIGLNRTNEAYSYLINLWNRQPENGLVNLELARIAASRGDTEQALRYYHNAIYANWPGNQETQTRNARLELIEYLLKINGKTQAQSELISLAAFSQDYPGQQARLGGLFLQAQDYEHALAAYRRSLSVNPRDSASLAGAGTAAFELGKYPIAQRFLQQAVAVAPGDAESRERLRVTELVLQMDPYRRQIRVAQRDRIVVELFAAAGDRLKLCPAAASYVAPGNPQDDLAGAWAKLKPQITESGLRRNPDLVNTAMELVFSIERQAGEWCGSPTETDAALLLIARLHEGS